MNPFLACLRASGPAKGHTADSESIIGPRAAAVGGLLQDRPLCPNPWQGIQSPSRPHPAPGKLKCMSLCRGHPEAPGLSRNAAGSQQCGRRDTEVQSSCIPWRPGAPESPAACCPLDLPLGGDGDSTGKESHQPLWLQRRRTLVVRHPRALHSLSRAMSSLDMSNYFSFHLKYI